MNETIASLPAPPRAEVLSVTDLVADVLAGKIRIPEFQRNWKWKPKQVQTLFDSLYRGFPIGSLFMWRRHRPGERFEIGRLEIVAGERHDSWAVIDGQQRLWSLVGALAHPDPRPDPDDPFAVWFDPEGDAFRGALAKSPPPATWIPVKNLHDSAELQDWLFDRPAFRENRELRQRAFEAGKRIREYRVPVYVVETEDDAVPREIYQRVNRGGTPMAEADVFDALVGRAARKPGRLEDLQAEAKALGMGELKRHKLLQCVMALRGLDVTRRLDDQRELRRLEGGLEDAAPALRAALAFLRREARIPHLRLLPYPVPLIVLTRFFHLFQDPNARIRRLLVRWVWRGLLTATHGHSERTRLRAAVQAVEADAEATAQRLLALVPREPSPVWWLDARFDGRSAASRITGLGLASLGPRHLGTSERLEIPALIESEGAEAFRHVAWEDEASGDLYQTAANRFLHPAGTKRKRFVELAYPPLDLIDSARSEFDASEILRSHAFDERAINAILEGRWQVALAARRDVLDRVLTDLAERLAEWGRNDRPSLDYLLRDEGTEAA